MKKHFLFDLDQTLVDTKRLRPYMGNPAGRRYVVENISNLPTELISPQVRNLVNKLSSKGQASILTNSPKEYAIAVLKKHGFTKLPVIGNGGKPLGSKIRNTMMPEMEYIMVGDSPGDIIAAHEARINSVGLTGEYPEKKLMAAEPTWYADDEEYLEHTILDLLNEDHEYVPRKNTEIFKFSRGVPRTEDIEIRSLGIYSTEKKKDLESSRILTFKKAKEESWKDITEGAKDSFFYNGEIVSSRTFKWTFEHYIDRAANAVVKLPGKVCIIAVPNSFPEYCYRTDIHRAFVSILSQEAGTLRFDSRPLRRVYPKASAHQGGPRGAQEHLRTIGYLDRFDLELETIVLFDDITTSGTQIKTAGKILRDNGYTGNLYGLTLGKTGDPEQDTCEGPNTYDDCPF